MAQGGVDKWNPIFRIACMLEAKLFNTGLRAPPTPYQIIPNGTYFIHISEREDMVLAIQNAKGFLQSLSDKFLARSYSSNTGSSVVGASKTGGDNEKVIEMCYSLFVLELTNLRSGLPMQLMVDTRSETWEQTFILEFLPN